MELNFQEFWVVADHSDQVLTFPTVTLTVTLSIAQTNIDVYVQKQHLLMNLC